MTYEQFLLDFPKLIAGYNPAPDVAAQIKNLELLMIIGPSGVGKSRIINELGIPYVPSDTTRPVRPGEQDGIDMYFLSDYQQILEDVRAGKFVQVIVGPGGDFYATRASSYPAGGWATMPVVAEVVPTFRSLGFARTLSAFIVPPTFDEWIRRMQVHRLSGDQLAGRLAEARRSLSFALKDDQIHFVLNDIVKDAVAQIKDLLDGRINEEREAIAKAIATANLKRIKDGTAEAGA